MPTRRNRFVLGLFLVLVAALAAAQEKISYAVTVADPESQMFNVAMTVRDAKNPLIVRIPAWCPGWYTITNYQENLSDIRAKAADGRTLRLDTLDKRTWQVQGGGPVVVVEYKVRGNDKGLGFFGCHLEKDVGFINPPALCMYPDGRTQEPVSLLLKLPRGWDVATALEDGTGSREFHAQDYDELVDMPFVIGHFKRVDFKASGVPMFATFASRDKMKGDPIKLSEEFRKISEAAIAIMGGAPMKKYHWNILLSGENFNGGLEHRASTTIAVGDRKDLSFPGLAAHEFFHLWNVKRIRPKVLGPFDYTAEQRTKNLWFAEGVTSYYADRILYRAKMIDKDGMIRSCLNEINNLQNCSDRARYTAEDASWNGWEGGSVGFGNLSYYNKGYVIGLLLDFAIRARTDGAKSLDDVMRYMLKKHNYPKAGYAEDGILLATNEVTGQDFADVYHKLAQSTEELPYGDLLSAAGLEFSGAAGTADPGFTTNLSGAYPRVSEVGDAGRQMGVLPGDVIVKVNDADARGLVSVGAKLRAGETFTVDVLRQGSRMKFSGTAKAMAAGATSLTVGQSLTDAQHRVLDGWLAR